nr:hypothetical protein CparaKRNrm3_p043 [Cryptomonas paramecium]
MKINCIYKNIYFLLFLKENVEEFFHIKINFRINLVNINWNYFFFENIILFIREKIHHIKIFLLTTIFTSANHIRTSHAIQKYSILYFLNSFNFLFYIKKCKKKIKLPIFYLNTDNLDKSIFSNCNFFSNSEYIFNTNIKRFYDYKDFVLEYLFCYRFFYNLTHFVHCLFTKNISKKISIRYIKNPIYKNTLLCKKHIDFIFLHLSHFLFFNTDNRKPRTSFFKLFFKNLMTKLLKFEFLLNKNELDQIYRRINFFLKKNKLITKFNHYSNDEFGFFFSRKKKTIFFLWGDFFLEKSSI